MKVATAAEVAPPAGTAAQIVAAIETILALPAYAEPATNENCASRAVTFLAAMSGAVGYHNAALGTAIFAVIQPPAGAAVQL